MLPNKSFGALPEITPDKVPDTKGFERENYIYYGEGIYAALKCHMAQTTIWPR
jgi:hypothetical protein